MILLLHFCDCILRGFSPLQLPPGRPVKDAIDMELDNMRRNMDE